MYTNLQDPSAISTALRESIYFTTDDTAENDPPELKEWDERFKTHAKPADFYKLMWERCEKPECDPTTAHKSWYLMTAQERAADRTLRYGLELMGCTEASTNTRIDLALKASSKEFLSDTCPRPPGAVKRP